MAANAYTIFICEKGGCCQHTTLENSCCEIIARLKAYKTADKMLYQMQKVLAENRSNMCYSASTVFGTQRSCDCKLHHCNRMQSFGISRTHTIRCSILKGAFIEALARGHKQYHFLHHCKTQTGTALLERLRTAQLKKGCFGPYFGQ